VSGAKIVIFGQEQKRGADKNFSPRFGWCFAVIVCLGWSITFWVVALKNACTILGKLLDLFDERAV
jgi:hypothetical protein